MQLDGGPVQQVEIGEWLDVMVARRLVRELASGVGFRSREAVELSIVASELGSNILKYGVRGALAYGPLAVDSARGAGVVLVARDVGPPFRNLELALQDGCDDAGPLDPILLLRRRGIGGGLGAVQRLTHTFCVRPLDLGKEIRVERFLTPRQVIGH